MKPIVIFECVSKKYRLGTNRTSLREFLNYSFNQAFLINKRDVSDKKSLWALRDVDFSIFPGQSLCLIGPNGAGKTTTLKILAGIVQPTSGRVYINGRVSALIELGAGFHPDLTGRENIYLNGAILGLTRREINRSFDQIVAFSGLEQFIDTPVKRYSSGMYVRLGFSVAAHVNPDILLVDEVLAVGDSQFRQLCAGKIRELKANGTTIVFVTHNLYLTKSVCDSAIFFANGQIKKHGDVILVVNEYESWLRENQCATKSSSLEDDKGTAITTYFINKVDVHNLKSKTGKLSYSDACEIRVHFSLKEPLRSPKLVIHIDRADGVRCCMIRSADYGFSIDSIDRSGILSLVISPLQLAQGAYVVEAHLLGELDGVSLAQKHSDWFQVSGISNGQDEMTGIFVPNVKELVVYQDTM